MILRYLDLDLSHQLRLYNPFYLIDFFKEKEVLCSAVSMLFPQIIKMAIGVKILREFRHL